MLFRTQPVKLNLKILSTCLHLLRIHTVEMWHNNLWCQYGTRANWKIPVIHLEQVCDGLTGVKRMRFIYLNSNKNITKLKHGSMLKHTIRKHSTIRIHLSLTHYCTEHDPHGSTKCLLFHSSSDEIETLVPLCKWHSARLCNHF